jgi:hypothetical protein
VTSAHGFGNELSEVLVLHSNGANTIASASRETTQEQGINGGQRKDNKSNTLPLFETNEKKKAPEAA